ncbi:MAG: hypothetical protein KJ736_00065, partial [Candidatus Omnitrophica bacterium]|nr:hypothetical protein [Candidatus Omnitrophota bacterium]
LLSDYASVDNNGKFTLVGAGFTEIAAKQIPFVHPMMYVFIRLSVTQKDVGQNRLGLLIIGEKGPIFNAEMNVNVKGHNKSLKYVPITSQIANLKFDHPGEYDIELRINGNINKCQTLLIKQIQNKKT